MVIDRTVDASISKPAAAAATKSVERQIVDLHTWRSARKTVKCRAITPGCLSDEVIHCGGVKVARRRRSSYELLRCLIRMLTLVIGGAWTSHAHIVPRADVLVDRWKVDPDTKGPRKPL